MKYPQLSNHDLIELLDTSRLMHHSNVPDRFKAIAHPTGHDLLEVIKERLELGAGAVYNEFDSNTRIDLDYLFSHNHDIESYIRDCIDEALDRRNLRLQDGRTVESLVGEIMTAIQLDNLIARAANEVFVLYVGFDLTNLEYPELLESVSSRTDFIIAKVK